MKKIVLGATVAAVAISIFLTNSHAQTTWTDGGEDGSWINNSNWSNNVPSNTTAVIFSNPVSIVGVDTGGATTVASITVNSGTSAFSIVPAISESLIVNGSFINSSVNTVNVNLVYTVGASATLDGPISFNNAVNIDMRTATISGLTTLGSTIVLQINNTTGSGYGRFSVGSGATLAFGGGANSFRFSPSSTYAGSNGDVFNLVANSGGSVTGLNTALFDISTLPTLTGGLLWDTTNIGSGVLAVTVPEPTTWALFATGLAAAMVFRPRRRQS